MWPDNETAQDLIGFRVHADLIRAVVTNPKMLPTTIGVFGDWGGGKTSIMKMLEHDLDPSSWKSDTKENTAYQNIAVLYFNTWLFEGYDDAKSAILTSILLQLAEHKRFGPKIRNKALSLIKSVDWMRVARLGLKHVVTPAAIALATGGVGAIPAAVALSSGISGMVSKGNPDADKAEEKKEKPDLEGLLKEASPDESVQVRTFRERFALMLKDSDITSLVVLIDDLDRCMPERIVESLEAIKLFLNVEKTAFVIGADPRIVRHAIRSRYAERSLDNTEDKEESDGLVKDYLEKVIQVPYYLPRLSSAEIESYMVLLFCQHHLADSHATLCLNACEQERIHNRYSTFGYADVKKVIEGVHEVLKEDLAGALSFCASAAPLIADGLKGNPRQVKRFLNALLLRKELARVAKLENIRDDVLVKLMILEYTQDKLFAELFALQAQQNGRPQQLADMEAAAVSANGEGGIDEASKKIEAKWATPRVKKWLAMEPQLRDVDLRDYFWVARDKLASTFTGISMVPPAVRKVIDGLFSDKLPKRNAALKAAHELREDELASLLTLVDQHIIRQPEEKAGYDALRFLAQDAIAGAAQVLADILLQRPLEKVPRSVGMDVMNLLNSKPELRGILEPVKEHLWESKAAIGVAARSAKGK